MTRLFLSLALVIDEIIEKKYVLKQVDSFKFQSRRKLPKWTFKKIYMLVQIVNIIPTDANVMLNEVKIIDSKYIVHVMQGSGFSSGLLHYRYSDNQNFFFRLNF